MKKRFWIAAGILVLVFCMFSGCGGKEKQQEELLLLPVNGEPAGDADEWEEHEAGAGEQMEEGRRAESLAKAVYVVHICGAVENPGVYLLEEGSRVYQAIEQAGGFRGDADEDYLNQADLLGDGMKLYVPTREEVILAGEAGSWQSINSGSVRQAEAALVNINTAGEELLCTLSGVGSSRAKSIIAYREKHGAFQKIEDIMNVEGIKDGLFQKIKDSITV